jgi:hypothetical protein
MEIKGKSASRKLFAKNCSDSHIASFFPYMFLLADLSHFSQQFRNQRKIVHCFDSHIQICLEKVLRSVALFGNFKAQFARNGSKF